MRRRQRAARSSVRTAEQRRSRYMGCNRGNAQPTAAHALQGKRKAWAVGCDEDSAQPTAVAEQRSSSYHSEATRQCAAHSGARIAKIRNSSNWSMAHPWCSFLSPLTWFDMWFDIYTIKEMKSVLLIDPHHIWKVIYNARSNKSHPPTSPNTAPATQNESHDWPCSHMEGHLQCAEQQESSSNFSKYCACHAKWISWLIRITYETSFTMRGATRVILQLHQILRLPRKMNLMIDPHHIWKVIYNARSNKSHPPTSPNTAPATQNKSHDWPCSHMEGHLQCAEQQESSSNFTEYCACHAKWISWLIRITYETSFTMRGATRVILQLHQILRLPRKMNLMIDPHHIWNVIYNARSN